MSPRLTAKLIVSAIVRRAHNEGGFAAIAAHGHDEAGSIMLQCTKMGRFSGLFERQMSLEGGYEWRSIGAMGDKKTEEIQAYITKRCGQDPDLWVIDLDVADPERFIAEMVTEG